MNNNREHNDPERDRYGHTENYNKALYLIAKQKLDVEKEKTGNDVRRIISVEQ